MKNLIFKIPLFRLSLLILAVSSIFINCTGFSLDAAAYVYCMDDKTGEETLATTFIFQQGTSTGVLKKYNAPIGKSISKVIYETHIIDEHSGVYIIYDYNPDGLLKPDCSLFVNKGTCSASKNGGAKWVEIKFI